MFKSFKYRLYPNIEQTLALEQTLETHRRLYNSALEQRKTVYETEKKSVKYTEQCARLTIVRAKDIYISKVNHASCAQTLRKLDVAFQNFFRRVKAGDKPGYPRFKGINRFDSFRFTYADGCKIRGKKLYLQFIGQIKVKWHREIPGDAVIKSATVRRHAGLWYIVFHCDIPDIEIIPSANPPIGIDLGLKAFLVTSEGESIEPPQFFKKAQKKLRVVQRTFTRKKKGSNRRKKAVKQVQKLYFHIANQRKDFNFKLAHKLVNQYGFIAHEDLNIKGLSRGMLAKSVNDAGWGNFLQILRYKAECAGVKVVEVNPKNTTQVCSQCGGLPIKKVLLSDRVYHCNSCGLIINRDHNAAKNILQSGWTAPSGDNVEIFSSCVA
jgi:putative transposase